MGNAEPVCCKLHHYGSHETEVINKLVNQLKEKGLIEDDDGSWGEIIVLVAKPYQEGVPWHEFKWQLCVSYHCLNQVTCLFTFSISRCDDAVKDVDPKAHYFIAINMDSGY